MPATSIRQMPLANSPSMVSKPYSTPPPSSLVNTFPPAPMNSSEVLTAYPQTVYHMSLADFCGTVRDTVAECRARGGNGLDATLDVDWKIKNAASKLSQNTNGTWSPQVNEYKQYQSILADPINTQPDETCMPVPSSQISAVPSMSVITARSHSDQSRISSLEEELSLLKSYVLGGHLQV